MQKVEGSSPFIRSQKPRKRGFFDLPRWLESTASAPRSHRFHHDEVERINQLLIDFFAAAA